MMPRDVQVLGLDKLRRRIKLIREAIVDDEVLHKMGQYQSSAIKRRTLSGKDIHGHVFEPYSDQYAFFREQRGYPTALVDLFFSGSMLNSLTHEVISGDNAVKIFFMPGVDPQGVSNPAKAFYLQEDREFFGFADEDEDKLFKIYNKWVEQRGFRG